MAIKSISLENLTLYDETLKDYIDALLKTKSNIFDAPSKDDFPIAGESQVLYLSRDTNYMYIYRDERYINIGSTSLDPDVIESKL